MSGSTTILDESTTAWLATAGSQIFLMQLGFLTFEVGFVKKIWASSVILKNIEDTFVGVLTYICFTYTLSQSPTSFYGLIAIPSNPFLIGVDTNLHAQLLSSMFFATTTDTIISGAVLERMKNKPYIVWCLLIILFNYSFVSHWIWHPDGWLSQLGFVDGAGALVVHGTGGIASLIAIWKLGPRQSSINRNDPKGPLLPIEQPENPIIICVGTFVLWFGWFAFNISSPIAYSKGIGDAIGTTALVTCISPICSCCCAAILMSKHYVDLNYNNLLSCLLSGLVAITGCCHTCNIWESAIIGFCAAPIYFLSSYIIRYKLRFDDPLSIVAIHLSCGIYSCLMEGIVANDVYNSSGLIYGGFYHFGVQLLGLIVVTLFNFCLSLFLWEIVMTKLIFRNNSMRVSILDTYLGNDMFQINGDYGIALEEIINSQSNLARRILWQFHEYTDERFASESLDYLIIIKIFRKLCIRHADPDPDPKVDHPTKILEIILKIISIYIEDVNSDKCVNISFGERSRLLRMKKLCIQSIQSVEKSKLFIEKYLKLENNDNVFDGSYDEVCRLIIILFKKFMNSPNRKWKNRKEKRKFKHKNIGIAFKLQDDWKLEWLNELKIIKSNNKPATLSHALLDIDLDNRSDRFKYNMDKLTVSDEKSLSKQTKSVTNIISSDKDIDNFTPTGTPVNSSFEIVTHVAVTNDIKENIINTSKITIIID